MEPRFEFPNAECDKTVTNIRVRVHVSNEINTIGRRSFPQSSLCKRFQLLSILLERCKLNSNWQMSAPPLTFDLSKTKQTQRLHIENVSRNKTVRVDVCFMTQTGAILLIVTENYEKRFHNIYSNSTKRYGDRAVTGKNVT